MKTLYKKFISLVGKIPQDKLLHFIGGMCIFFFIYIIMKWLVPSNICIARGLGIFTVIALGFVKEYLVDERWMKGKPDLKDAWATDLGGIFALFISIFM